RSVRLVPELASSRKRACAIDSFLGPRTHKSAGGRLARALYAPIAIEFCSVSLDDAVGLIRISRMLPLPASCYIEQSRVQGNDCVSSRTVERRGGTTASLRTPGS